MDMPSIVLIAPAERRRLIKEQLGAQASAIVGELTGEAAQRLVAGLAPDIVVLDTQTPTVNPLTLIPALLAEHSTLRIIAVASSSSRAERNLLLELGARAVVQPANLQEALASLPATAQWPARDVLPAIERPHSRAA